DAVDDDQATDLEAHELARSEHTSVAGMTAADILRVARSPGLAALPRFTLANGLQVVAIERPTAALARIELLLPGGSANEVPYADLLSDISEEGCRELEPLREVGGTSRVSHGRFASRLSLVVPDGNVVNGLAALADEARCHHIPYGIFYAVQEALRRARVSSD